MIQIGHRSIRHVIVFLASFSFAAALPAAEIPPTGKPIWLFDGKSLEQFDTLVHSRGLNNDPDGVFRVHDGMVHVSGSPYGYFITKKDYGDYYLRAEFKWGEATHPFRKGLARDSGILYHATGEDKSAGPPRSIWPTSIEFQIMEGSTGDVILLGGSELTVNGETKTGGIFPRFNKTVWQPARAAYKAPVGYRDPPGKEVEKPHGEWNVLEMVSDGDHIKYWVNGTLVMEGTNASLTRGKILFQSEGAELFYRNIELRPLEKKER